MGVFKPGLRKELRGLTSITLKRALAEKVNKVGKTKDDFVFIDEIKKELDRRRESHNE